MNESMLGVINATYDFSATEQLTGHRSLAALPFAGRYRLIDFMLSNMVNSDIHSVAIFTGHKNRSLMDHLGSGKQWDLDRKRDGLFVFTPNRECDEEDFGSFNHLGRNLDYFLRSKQKYIVITNCHIVTAMNFKPVLRRHIEVGADITEVRHQGQSLHTYILEKEFMLNLFEQYKDKGFHSLIDVIKEQYNSLRAYTYEYDGYVAVIDSVESYYKHSLEMLEPAIWKQLFVGSAPVFTKVKDEPPTRYGAEAKISNSMVANGSMIEGNATNSIVFRSVKIGKGSVVQNSIIMQKSQIGNNCVLEHVILDKDVKVADGAVLKGTAEAPLIVKKGTVQGALMNS